MTSVTFDMYLSPEDRTEIEIYQYKGSPGRVRLTFEAELDGTFAGISMNHDQLKELRDKITRFRRDNKH
jgi:hypothetical protein